MPIPGTVQVTATIARTDITDTYAVTDTIYGIDGLRSVQTLLDRNNISTPRRREGMLVYVRDDGKYYKLNTDLISWTDFGATLGAGFTTIASSISPAASYDIVLGTTISYKYGKFLLHVNSTSKWYTSEYLVGKDQNNISVGFTPSEYGIIGEINIYSELIVSGPNLVFRITNNELISVNLEVTEIFSV